MVGARAFQSQTPPPPLRLPSRICSPSHLAIAPSPTSATASALLSRTQSIRHLGGDPCPLLWHPPPRVTPR